MTAARPMSMFALDLGPDGDLDRRSVASSLDAAIKAAGPAEPGSPDAAALAFLAALADAARGTGPVSIVVDLDGAGRAAVLAGLTAAYELERPEIRAARPAVYTPPVLRVLCEWERFARVF